MGSVDLTPDDSDLGTSDLLGGSVDVGNTLTQVELSVLWGGNALDLDQGDVWVVGLLGSLVGQVLTFDVHCGGGLVRAKLVPDRAGRGIQDASRGRAGAAKTRGLESPVLAPVCLLRGLLELHSPHASGAATFGFLLAVLSRSHASKFTVLAHPSIAHCSCSPLVLTARTARARFSHIRVSHIHVSRLSRSSFHIHLWDSAIVVYLC